MVRTIDFGSMKIEETKVSRNSEVEGVKERKLKLTYFLLRRYEADNARSV